MKRSHVWIGVLICAMFVAVIVALFTREPPARAMEPLLILVGSLAAAFGAVVQFFFGTSASSAEKTALLAGRGEPPKP